MTATKIKDISEEFTGEAWLYKMDPPYKSHMYVIASAAIAGSGSRETSIFGATASGRVTNWGELDDSFRVAMDCDQAIRNAGYNIVDGPPVSKEERS